MASGAAAVPAEQDKNALKMECEVCWDRFSTKKRSRQPYVGGSCGHSFCQRCAVQLRRKRKCGKCRAPFKPVKNFALIDCMEKMSGIKKNFRGKNKKLKEKLKQAEVEIEEESSEESEPESEESEIEEIPIVQHERNAGNGREGNPFGARAAEFQQIYDVPRNLDLDDDFLADLPRFHGDGNDVLAPFPPQRHLGPRIVATDRNVMYRPPIRPIGLNENNRFNPYVPAWPLPAANPGGQGVPNVNPMRQDQIRQLPPLPQAPPAFPFPVAHQRQYQQQPFRQQQIRQQHNQANHPRMFEQQPFHQFVQLRMIARQQQQDLQANNLNNQNNANNIAPYQNQINANNIVPFQNNGNNQNNDGNGNNYGNNDNGNWGFM